ncbi:5'-methylthioadenosine/S-adenosylhomocysteine nucleosidase [Chloroflexi bacterium CFX2]|nr:5'-methylthioadenosine/S-adenosylhomocysteine nucleosidase [Chloroflexi bacterium CFX2]
MEAGVNIHFGVMASGDEDVIDMERGRELHRLSGAPYLELRGATDTANHEAPVVFDENLKIVMKNIAHVLVNWLG